MVSEICSLIDFLRFRLRKLYWICSSMIKIIYLVGYPAKFSYLDGFENKICINYIRKGLVIYVVSWSNENRYINSD